MVQQTVVVGVKLDSDSRELLTWALVKVAQPGDSVLAVHVLHNNEIVDRDGKASLLSLVKTFDSVLAVYEGFCNLKQVDLKLKICRGTSVKKILVREAISYSASQVIVGTATTHHKLRSSISVAKYCAKKLSTNFCVLAVSNGKVVFKRDSLASQGTDDGRRNRLLDVIHRSISLSKNTRTIKSSDVSPESVCDLALDTAGCDVKRSCCSVCGMFNEFRDEPCKKCEDKCSRKDESLAIVSVPEARPGWPLLRPGILVNKQALDEPSLRKISVVQWALRLPTRQPLYTTDSNLKQIRFDRCGGEFSNLDGETGAIVPVGSSGEVRCGLPDSDTVDLPEELEGLHEKYSATCRLFQYQELLSATSDFSDENLIGKGGSSRVYKGCPPDGKELAVKILKQSETGLKEFILEIEIITALNHKNIISLLGFCFDDKNLLLVYDFLSRGSLEENLHGNKDLLAFGWNERYKVAVGVAEALDYLHREKAPPVIHRDVKSSNILLSDDFEPQLSDFGLAKWASTSSTHITCSDVAGTFGYLAPEYFMFGKVNEKIDVYAFGVVLLELLSGRKPISNEYPKGQESLVIWATPILNSGKVTQLLDSTLGDNYDHDQMERMVLAAMLCIKRSPRARPQMSMVVKLLQGESEVVKWARLQVKDLEASEILDEEACMRSNLQSHLNTALLDVEDDSFSMSSIEPGVSLEDYLQGRWSRSSSFD